MILYEHPSSGNCLKARVMLDQVGADYERVELDLFAGETRTPEHFARNPDGRIPVLELDDGNYLAESGAILLYLAEGTEYLPADPVERARVHAWMFFEQNQVEANIGVARFLALSGRASGVPEVFADRQRRGRDALGTLEGVGGQVLGALGQVKEDRAGLGEVGAVVELEHRDPAVRVAGEVLGRARLAREQVELHALVVGSDLVEHDARLQAVARGRVLVEDQAASAPSRSSSAECASSAAITVVRCSSKSTPRSSAPERSASRSIAAAKAGVFIFFLTDLGVIPWIPSGRT